MPNNRTKKRDYQDSIKKYFSSEAKFIIAIIGFVIGVVAPYYDIKQDVALIKENHFVHIENLQNQVKELKERDIQLQEQYIDLLKALTKQ